MSSNPLRYQTPRAWTETVLADFDSFLLDHAMAEKKASGMAISMLSHYPDKVDLVAAMAEAPKLIERPIVVKGDRAVLGRPPENVLALID